ncbi:hypothetical protein quinque_002377 [Culex quinquefasciatus]
MQAHPRGTVVPENRNKDQGHRKRPSTPLEAVTTPSRDHQDAEGTPICCQITIRTPVKENRAKTHEDRPEPKASSATIARPSLAEDQENGERRPRKTKGIACERSLFLRRLRTALICAVPEQQHGRSSHETAGTSPRGFSRAIGFVWRINSVERRGASWCQAPIARARERGQLASCARAAASTGAEEVWVVEFTVGRPAHVVKSRAGQVDMRARIEQSSCGWCRLRRAARR